MTRAWIQTTRTARHQLVRLVLFPVGTVVALFYRVEAYPMRLEIMACGDSAGARLELFTRKLAVTVTVLLKSILTRMTIKMMTTLFSWVLRVLTVLSLLATLISRYSVFVSRVPRLSI